MIDDAHTTILGPTSDEIEQVKYFRQLGRAYFRSKDTINGRRQIAILERRLQRIQQETDRAVDTAVAKARFHGEDAKSVETKKNQAQQSNAEKSKALERALHELHGYVLLDEAKPADALERFSKAHDVDEALLADVELLVGKADESLKRLRDWQGRSKNQVRPLAAVIEMAWRQGKKDEARQAFESLRDISGAIDLDLPPFARLQPIAAELGYNGDWRKSKPVARNAAELPDLSTLGPLTWSPPIAPDWSLPDANDHRHSLAEYQGKPVIVLFYLGYGCLHCAEQLQAFVAKRQSFSDNQISIVAISTDTTTNLQKSLVKYQTDGQFPFQLLSDSPLETFKKYQAFDDFESTALHATCLIDGNGTLRWHDIGAEPFMNVDFLLNESKRLLHPDQFETPIEPELLDDNGPADAVSPRNVFPSSSQPTEKPGNRPVTAQSD